MSLLDVRQPIVHSLEENLRFGLGPQQDRDEGGAALRGGMKRLMNHPVIARLNAQYQARKAKELGLRRQVVECAT